MHKRFLSAAVIAGLILSLLPSQSTYAVGGVVVISEVLTGTTQSASAEFVELHNQTTDDIDVTGWKIQYLSATGVTVNVRATLAGILRANGYMFAATTEFGSVGDASLNAGMPESGGRLRLVNSSNAMIDTLSWGGSTLQSEGLPALAPAKGQSLLRKNVAGVLIDSDNNADDFAISMMPTANGGDVYEPVDVCLNIDGNQTALPDGYQLNGDECVPIPPPVIEYPTIRLNEILPDPGSPKTDANDEFIELYNPNDTDVDVTGYKIMSGSSLASAYVLPTYIIPAHGFVTLFSSETKIGLSNSGSRLQLQSPDQKSMGDELQYGAIGTDQACAYFDDGWKLTDKPTPNVANELFIETEEPGMGSGETILSPCPSGKYRNPLTNRCRSIETDASVLAACDADEYRNPETNRCRKLASLATATITPCQEGYERNPETNRCRKTTNDADVVKPCAAGQERNPETNRCRKVAGASTRMAKVEEPKNQGMNAMGGVALGIVGLAAVSYGAYEWRNEIAKGFIRLLAFVGRK